MILTKKTNITIRNDMRKLYTDLGYNIPSKRNPVIEIDVKDLQRKSQKKVDVKCDICGKIKTICYWTHRESIEKYGYYSCLGKCSQNKNKLTSLEKYGDENYNNRDKYRLTNLKKYGVDNIAKLDIRDEKSKQTKLEKYGDENYNNRDKYRLTNLKKYDNENYNNPSKNKKTCLEKYGVEYPIQVLGIHEKQQISGFNIKKYSDSNLYYRGTYELDFLKKYHNTGITKAESIKYQFDNKNKVYHPDFYYEPLNLIIEVKSNYTLNYDLKKI